MGAGAAGAGPGADAFCPGSWYFSGISRARAQQLLLSPANAPGAFLVRPSESSHGDYSLSGTRRAPGVPRPGCPTAGQARSPHPTCLHPRAACRGGAPWARGPPRPTPAAAHAPSFSARLQASAGRREGWAATRPGWREWAARTRPSPVPTAVRAQAKVRHYRISAAADGLYLQKGRLFPSLEELLAYYAANWKLIRNPLLQPCVAQVGRCPAPPAPAPGPRQGSEQGHRPRPVREQDQEPERPGSPGGPAVPPRSSQALPGLALPHVRGVAISGDSRGCGAGALEAPLPHPAVQGARGLGQVWGGGAAVARAEAVGGTPGALRWSSCALAAPDEPSCPGRAAIPFLWFLMTGLAGR